MIPIAIPAAARAARPWCKPVSMGPPPGVSDEDCGTVQMLIEPTSVALGGNGAAVGRAQYVYYRPLDAEIEDLRNGGFIEFAQYGQVVQPFSAAVWPAPRLPDLT